MMSTNCRSRATSTSLTVTPLTRAVMDRMLAGVSTRKFAVVGEPVGEALERESSSTYEEHGVGDVRRADEDRAR